MKKLVRIRKVILVLFLILVAFITKTYLFDKKESEKNVIEKQEILQQNMDYTKKIIDDSSMKLKKIRECISNEVQIVVLREIGIIELFHDKTPENNKYIEWAIDSNISLKVYYTAILTIGTENIQLSYDDNSDRINIVYDLEKIKVKSINVDNILSETSKGIFGNQYSAKETSALTLIATDKIKEKISNDDSLKHLASMNLEGYLTNLSYALEVYDINIIKK